MKKILLIIIPIIIISVALGAALGYFLRKDDNIKPEGSKSESSSSESSSSESSSSENSDNEDSETAESGYEFNVGRVVVCNNNIFVIAYEDGSFLQMNTASKDIFNGLKTGDKIRIKRSSAIAMSYPGQCFVKSCQKQEDGDISDVPQSIVSELEKIGWLSGSSIGENISPNNYDAFPEAEVNDEILAELINSHSELCFDLLLQMTEDELRDHNAEAGFGCYILRMGEGINIDYDDGCEYEEYEWNYTLTAYPDESDGGWYVTRIRTNSPYALICGIRANSGIESLRENYESKHFEVKVSNNVLTAERGGIRIIYVINGEKDVEINVFMTVTNKEGIIY